MTERPRERFLSEPIDNITNEELLAILLSTGTKEMSVKNLASRVLSYCEKLDNIDQLTIRQLTDIKGIGEVKAITLLAAIELGKRLSRKVPTIYNKKITNASLVYDYYSDKLGDKKQEYFYCLYLDNNKRMIKEKLLFIGTINYSTVHPREIFKEAYLASASTVICVHNHPSGNTDPSKMDVDFTNQLIDAGNLLGIPLIDHVIVGFNKYYSFFENKK